METVQVTDLRKTYGQITAVDGVSLRLRQGEIFGLLGPNGAGKTTTINMLSGLARPTSGCIVIGGINLDRGNIKKVQSMIGVIPDEDNLYDEMDGLGNLCFCASLYGLKKREREARARLLLQRFDLEKAGGRPFRAYSKGMKRKLTIAAGLIHDPRILFLDEPTTGIDVQSADQIRQMVESLRQQGKTILLTTHYLEEAERLCQRVAFLMNGKIIKEDSIAKFMETAGAAYQIELRVAGNTAALWEWAGGINHCQVEIISEKRCLLVCKEALNLAPLFHSLHKKGIAVYEARRIKPSLADVFLEITTAEREKDEISNRVLADFEKRH